jgi:protein gp37
VSDSTSIEWCDATWNPMRGCSRVSAGCQHCYAERFSARFSAPPRALHYRNGLQPVPAGRYHGFVKQTRDGPRWTGKVELVESELDRPLKWRKPKRIFVNSMSDTFHAALPDEAIAAVLGVMASAPRHTFLVLTKRPELMFRFFEQGDSVAAWLSAAQRAGVGVERGVDDWKRPLPLPNVWFGVSVEDQKTADERIPLLLSTPAAKRFVSYEPALGPVQFGVGGEFFDYGIGRNADGGPRIDWVIVGGESGPGARRFDVAWALSTIAQCKAAGVACFVKQIGAEPYGLLNLGWCARPQSKKGGDPSEWPAELRVREFPHVAVPA